MPGTILPLDFYIKTIVFRRVEKLFGGLWAGSVMYPWTSVGRLCLEGWKNFFGAGSAIYPWTSVGRLSYIPLDRPCRRKRKCWKFDGSCTSVRRPARLKNLYNIHPSLQLHDISFI